VKIAYYCPNKPLSHPHPSGDLIIAGDIRDALNHFGHRCEEIVQFRARWFWESPGGWKQAMESLIQALRRTVTFKPDAWLTYHTYYKSPDVVGPWVSRLLNLPYILFQPMYATKWKKTPRTRTGFYLNRLALGAAAHAFANNSDDLEALSRVVPSNRVTYIPPGILPEEFEGDPEAGAAVRLALGVPGDIPLIMTAARFRPGVKFESLAYLFRSLALLSADGRPFMLMVVGDGPMEGELRQMAERLLPGRVVFTGGIARRKMSSYYSAADLFIFPGIGESLGMVFLEAQSCGLPVVALNTAGVPQVVQTGRTGILVEKDDGRAMALAAGRLLDHPEERETLGSNGRVFVREERNIRTSHRRFAQMLEEIVRDRYPKASTGP
jgi:glycosyltransferase involved in cell wall biosynthesis